MGELAEFLQAAASFGDESAGPSCAAPTATSAAPPRTPSSSAAPAATAGGPPALPAAEAWELQAAHVAACAPGADACAAAGAMSHSALNKECPSWEPSGSAERPASIANAEARGAAAAQPASGSRAWSVREQMAELEQGLHAVMPCAELWSAPLAYAAPAKPACTAPEGFFGRSACSAGAAPLPASPQGGSASAAQCAALPAARPPPCQAPALGSPLTSADCAPMLPSAPEIPMHLSSSPLHGQATRGSPQRALPGAAALRQSLQAEDAATPLAAGLRFGAWVDALGPPSAERGQSGRCQQAASRACGGHPDGPNIESAGLAGGGGGWGGAPGAWAGCAARLGEGAELRAEQSRSSGTHCTVAASAAWREAGSAGGSGRGEMGACGAQECDRRRGSAGPPWEGLPADTAAATARSHESGGPPWQPARADGGSAAGPASGNPFAGRPMSYAAGPLAASPDTLAHGNPFRRASAPKASSGSS